VLDFTESSFLKYNFMKNDVFACRSQIWYKCLEQSLIRYWVLFIFQNHSAWPSYNNVYILNKLYIEYASAVQRVCVILPSSLLRLGPLRKKGSLIKIKIVAVRHLAFLKAHF